MPQHVWFFCLLFYCVTCSSAIFNLRYIVRSMCASTVYCCQILNKCHLVNLVMRCCLVCWICFDLHYILTFCYCLILDKNSFLRCEIFNFHVNMLHELILYGTTVYVIHLLVTCGIKLSMIRTCVRWRWREQDTCVILRWYAKDLWRDNQLGCAIQDTASVSQWHGSVCGEGDTGQIWTGQGGPRQLLSHRGLWMISRYWSF